MSSLVTWKVKLSSWVLTIKCTLRPELNGVRTVFVRCMEACNVVV